MTIMKIEPWMWGVISNAVLIRWTLPDPPPDEIVDLATLASINVLASSLTDASLRESVQSAIGDSLAQSARSSTEFRTRLSEVTKELGA
jgi:hypothetical protein